MPVTSWPASRNSGISRRPIAPLAPAIKTRISASRRDALCRSFSRSSASAILAFRACASSRFSFSSSTTSSGARDTKFGLPSLASTRAMSASALAISLASRARSAARSITPLSGSAATSPRMTSCTAPCGGASAKEMSATRASRWMNSDQCFARIAVSADAFAKTKGSMVAGGMFISTRTDRIAVIRSTTQPISPSATVSSRPSWAGHASSASM